MIGAARDYQHVAPNGAKTHRPSDSQGNHKGPLSNSEQCITRDVSSLDSVDPDNGFLKVQLYMFGQQGRFKCSY